MKKSEKIIFKKGLGDFNRNINCRAVGIDPYKTYMYHDGVWGKMVFFSKEYMRYLILRDL